ncbi:CAPG protein, partial [Atrichornis clamosus]|nr:CAPG protein [Atrichornis clamosus]
PHSGSPFSPAAARPGLHIWRVEQLRPVEVPEATLGVFFSGDSYLVLHNGPEEQAHLHLWMGQNSSQDEWGACALLSTQLSSLLGERPVTHREVQGNESDLFMEYFPRGLTYQEGGVASAFKRSHSGPGPGPAPKLYQVKGKRKIRASERDPAWASFNTGDCFLLDLGQTLFIWCGAWSNVLERSRAQELAAAIRDSERGGKALKIVADGEEPPEMVQVLGPKPPLQEGSPKEDVVADQTNAGAAVLDAMGRMDLTQVAAGSPFSQSLLCPDDCFVLDNGAGGKVYVWKGAQGGAMGWHGDRDHPSTALTSLFAGCKANEQERQAALRVAEEVITRMGHPPQTQVEILPQGCETPLFKQFFTSWNPCHLHCCAIPVPLPTLSPSPCHFHSCAIPVPVSLPFPSPCQSFISLCHACVIPAPLPFPVSSLCLCPPHAHITRLSLCHSHVPMPVSLPSPFSCPPCAMPMSSPSPSHVLLVPTPSLCHSHLHTIPKPVSFLPLCYPIIPAHPVLISVPIPTPLPACAMPRHLPLHAATIALPP